MQRWMMTAAALATPVAAQTPTVDPVAMPQVVGTEGRNNNCHTGIQLQATTTIPASTMVQYLVSTTSGYDYFRNHGVAVLLADGSTLNDI